eukprot:4268194-Lingulodinium_polyedra.AAC.1
MEIGCPARRTACHHSWMMPSRASGQSSTWPRKTSPEELKDELPMALPMTHTIKSSPCIAKYPVDEWETTSAPTMTAKGWANPCLKVAERTSTTPNASSTLQQSWEATTRN